MNRQYKRMMERQETQKKASGPTRPPVKPAGAPTKRERTKPLTFIREVLAELKKVAWPTRQEVIAYSIVVLVSAVVLGALIFFMDLVFTKAVLKLFGIET